MADRFGMWTCLGGFAAVNAGVLACNLGLDGGAAGLVASASFLGVNVATELGASSLADLFRRALGRLDDRRGNADNDVSHDLHRLAATAIRRALERGIKADDGRLTPEQSRRLRKLAAQIPESWIERLRRGDTEHGPAISEDGFVDLFRAGHAVSGDAPPLGDPERWAEFLIEYEPWGQGALTDEEAAIAGELVAVHFVGAARDVARDDFAKSGTAYPALVLRLLSLLCKGQEAALASISEEHAETRRMIIKSFGSARTRAIEIRDEVLRSHPDDHARLEPLVCTFNAHAADLRQRLEDVLAGIELLLEEAAQQAEQMTAADGSRPSLFRRLDEVEAVARDAASARPPALLPTDNLSAELRARHQNFVGRVEELGELHRRLTETRDDGAESVVHAITGEGGIGKTQLTLAYAINRADAWEGRWWIDGAQGRFDDSCEALSRSLRLERPARWPPEGVRAAICDRLNLTGGRHLIVIDNAEPRGHDHDPWRAYRQLTLASPSRVIITTRTRDRLRDFAEPYAVGMLTPDDAIKMLRAARPESFGDGAHNADLGAVAKHLGYHGLALRYAAAWLDMHATSAPRDLLSALRDAELGPSNPLEEPGLAGRAAGYERSTAAALWLQIEDLVGGQADWFRATRDALTRFFRSARATLATGSDSAQIRRSALDLAVAAAFIDPDRMPLAMLAEAVGVARADIEAVLNLLAGRSVITVTPASDEHRDADWAYVGMHRLTQSMLRRWAWAERREFASWMVGRLLKSVTGVLEERAHTALWHRVSRAPHGVAMARNLRHRLAEQPRRAQEDFEPVDVMMLHRHLSWHFYYVGMLSNALEHINVAIAWAESQSGGLSDVTADWIAWRARVQLDLNDMAEAERDIARCVEWGEARSPVCQVSLATWYAEWANIRLDRGDIDGADRDLSRSIEWRERRRGELQAELYHAQSVIAHPLLDLSCMVVDPDVTQRFLEANESSLAIAYNVRAAIHAIRGDLARASEDVARSIDWEEQRRPVNEWELSVGYSNRSTILRDLGDLTRAESDINWCIEWGKAQPAPNERAIAKWYARRAIIRQKQGNVDGACQDIARSMELEEKQASLNERAMAMRLRTWANIRLDQDDIAGAATDIQRALDWAESASPRNEQILARMYVTRARVRQAQGDIASALIDIERGISWAESTSPRDERTVARWSVTYAAILADSNRLNEAHDRISQATEAHERFYGSDHTWTAGAKQLRASIASRARGA